MLYAYVFQAILIDVHLLIPKNRLVLPVELEELSQEALKNYAYILHWNESRDSYRP